MFWWFQDNFLTLQRNTAILLALRDLQPYSLRSEIIIFATVKHGRAKNLARPRLDLSTPVLRFKRARFVPESPGLSPRESPSFFQRVADSLPVWGGLSSSPLSSLVYFAYSLKPSKQVYARKKDSPQ